VIKILSFETKLITTSRPRKALETYLNVKNLSMYLSINRIIKMTYELFHRIMNVN